jgi:hypothetical protein
VFGRLLVVRGVRPECAVGWFFGWGFVVEECDELPEAADAEDGDVGYEGCLRHGFLGDDDLAVARVGGCEYGGQYSADGAYSPVESEFAEHHQVGDAARIDAFGGAEDGAGDGEVESAAALGDCGGAESYGEFPLGPFGAGVDDGRPYAVAAFGEAFVGQPYEGERGDAWFEVCLDFDDDAFDSDERH